MAKRESSFINMVSTLLIICLVSALSLGVINMITKPAIEASKQSGQASAIASVLPEYDKLGESYMFFAEGMRDSMEVFPALDSNGKEIAAAVKSYSYNGFSGYISIMVGLDVKGNVTGYSVLEHKETPGLGTKMVDWFKSSEKPSQSIIGKGASTTNFTVSKDGGDIDAITAATISSRAFLEAVCLACKVYDGSLDGLSSASNKSDK